ncbi:MAG: ABC transporter permease, partial [Acidobacteriota bacterium]|nr:ABC transporter permease [Acidobacteriota bacterium]
VVLGRFLGGAPEAPAFVSDELPIFVVIFIVIGAVLSLTTIIAIYREGGILKRLKATPISPLVILGTHVVVKLILTSVTLVLLVLAGRRFYSGSPPPAPWSFFLGVVLVSVSLMALGFVLASVVRTARFAQPVGSVLLYALLTISGLFFPLEYLPRLWRVVAIASPLTHAVDLLRGLWTGAGWAGVWIAVVALFGNLVICTMLSARIFRWE